VRYGLKSRLDPAYIPNEVRQEERFAELEKETDQYGRPLSKTAVMMRQAIEEKRRDDPRMPWRIGGKR
jgi:hypothetical protein